MKTPGFDYDSGYGLVDALAALGASCGVPGDLNGDGKAELAGLNSSGNIFYSTNLASWNYIPGLLSQLVTGDFNGDGWADLAGINSSGNIFYSTNLTTWNYIQGF